MNKIVYSTLTGGRCPRCQKKINKCTCKPESPPPKSDGIVRVSRESKGRKGKGVTLVSGLPLKTAELKALAKTLKVKCGCGGTIKNHVIEIQGENRDLLVELLTEMGWKVKKVGG